METSWNGKESRKIIKKHSIDYVLITILLVFTNKSASFSLHISRTMGNGQGWRGRITNLNREPEACAYKSPGNGDSLSKSPSLISLYIGEGQHLLSATYRGHER